MPADSSPLLSPEREVALDASPESGDRIRALATAQATLAERLDTLERLVRRLRAGRTEAAGAARLSKLQEAVADLAAAQYDTRQQLDALAGAVDHLAIEHFGSGAPGDEQVDGADTMSEPSPTATFIPPVAARGWQPRLKRWARLILRSTLGKLRWIWDSAHPRPPWGDDIRLVLKKASTQLPSLTVVIQTSGNDAQNARLETWLDSQAGREGIRRIRTDATGEPLAIDTDYVWRIGAAAADLPPTFVESARLLLATEALDFVCFETLGSDTPQWIVAKELRQTNGRLDLRSLSRRAKRHPGRVLGKIAGGDGSSDQLPRDLCRPEIRRRVRRSGPYVVAVATKPRTVKHRLAPPSLETQQPQAEPRPAVLLLLTAPLAGGLERLLAAILEDLVGAARIVVATTVPPHPWTARWRALEHSTPYVYALGGIFAEELHADLLQQLITRHGVQHMLHIGDRGLPPEIGSSLRHGSPTLQLEDLTATPPPRLQPVALEPSDTGKRLRHELGWPADAFVVAMWADFIDSQRPEDFVALAHRFRDDPRFRFILVGDGPLGADLRDLNRLFGLTNLHIERAERDLGEVLDAAEVVCTTAEHDPLPHAVPAALLRRRPVVAAAIDDLPRLLESGPCGIVVPHPGDLDGFEAALRSLAQTGHARELGELGPAAVRDVYTLGSDSRRSRPDRPWRQALDLPGLGEARDSSSDP